MFSTWLALAAQAENQWASPDQNSSPIPGSKPPPIVLSPTLSPNKRIFVLEKTPPITLPSSLKSGLSRRISNFESNNPYEVLVPGWKAVILTKGGVRMTDWRECPGKPSALGCFPGPEPGEVTLISNQNKTNKDQSPFAFPISKDLIFDPKVGGGCTRLVVGFKEEKVLRQEWALVGTACNYAGTTTPWGTFLTGESQTWPGDNTTPLHGYLFEIDPLKRGIAAPLPIELGGAIAIGGICVDENSRAIYIGENSSEGFVYRFKPKIWGQLKYGGKLSAMRVKGTGGLLSQNIVDLSAARSIYWIPLPSNMSDVHAMALQLNATAIGRIGGFSVMQGGLVICLTKGGKEGKGELLRVSGNKISILEESKTGDLAGVENPGNVYVTDKGELLFCERKEKGSGLKLLDSLGNWRTILWVKDGPIGGITLSPNGFYIFVNLEGEGITLLLKKS